MRRFENRCSWLVAAVAFLLLAAYPAQAIMLSRWRWAAGGSSPMP